MLLASFALVAAYAQWAMLGHRHAGGDGFFHVHAHAGAHQHGTRTPDLPTAFPQDGSDDTDAPADAETTYLASSLLLTGEAQVPLAVVGSDRSSPRPAEVATPPGRRPRFDAATPRGPPVA